MKASLPSSVRTDSALGFMLMEGSIFWEMMNADERDEVTMAVRAGGTRAVPGDRAKRPSDGSRMDGHGKTPP